MKIIKIGGSLLAPDRLKACLRRVAARSETALVVIGGGSFADQIRAAQQLWQFNDVTAHHMAILAMQQTALLAQALQPDWALVQSLNDLRHWPAQNRIGLWFPDITLLNKQSIPATWRITSDSLAAWLASITPTTELLIVKATAIESGTALPLLVAQGILDDAFLDYAKPDHYKITVVNYHDFVHTT